MIEISEKKCFLGKSINVSNGFIEFSVPKHIGPRIISFNKVDGPNILFQDINEVCTKDVSQVFGKGKIWRNYGGHRLWLSPENEETYYPDDEPVDIEKTDNGLILTSKPWRKINILPSMKIEFVGENSIKITHKVQNLGENRELCLWALTVMKCGGRLEIPLETRDTILLPNRNVVLWPYTDISDKRLEFYDNKIVMKSDNKSTKNMKIGIYKDIIKAKYFIGNNIFTKSFLGDKDGRYPDFHCNFESYASKDIHEIESLSPIKTIVKNSIIEHTEIWDIE